eukprot:205231_1
MGTTSSHSHFSEQYKQGKHIATGSYAIVKKCKRRSDNQQFAVKIVQKADLTLKELKLIKDEIHILQLLTQQTHPNSVHLEHVFEDEKSIIMVMELCHTSNLLDIIHSSPKKRLSEKTCAQIASDIAKSLQFLHSNHIVHRDLKPENILFAKDRTLKIADFGSAKLCRKEGMKTQVGTPYYVAPEIICTTTRYYSNKVDVWSLGIILYLMLCGCPPFSARKGIKTLYRNILKGNYSFASPIWRHISDEAKDLVKRLLSVDVAQRLSVNEVLSHPWILKYNPR